MNRIKGIVLKKLNEKLREKQQSVTRLNWQKEMLKKEIETMKEKHSKERWDKHEEERIVGQG